MCISENLNEIGEDIENNELPTPTNINLPKQLVVEGKDMVCFFKVFLDKLDLNDIQIRNLGGTPEYLTKLPVFIKSSNFKNDVISLGIAIDAETNPPVTFQRIQKALRDSKLPSPDSPETLIQIESEEYNLRSINTFIFPNALTEGMLESLLIEAVESDPVWPCIDGYFNCIENVLHEPIRQKPKAQLRVFLASRKKPATMPSQAILRKYIPFDSPVFDDVKTFLKSL